MKDKEKMREVSLEELNNVVGGRLLTINEWSSYSDALRQAQSVARKLPPEERKQYWARFDATFEQWYNDLDNAPEGTPEIFFDKYWKG